MHVILQDANARGIVTNADKAEYLFKDVPASEVPVVLCVDKAEDMDAVARQPVSCVPESIKRQLHSEGLIYIIYTSGSTGKPKVHTYLTFPQCYLEERLMGYPYRE